MGAQKVFQITASLVLLEVTFDNYFRETNHVPFCRRWVLFLSPRTSRSCPATANLLPTCTVQCQDLRTDRAQLSSSATPGPASRSNHRETMRECSPTVALPA